MLIIWGTYRPKFKKREAVRLVVFKGTGTNNSGEHYPIKKIP